MDEQECFDSILDTLTYIFERVDVRGVEQWCYPRGDYSGRDFYDYIPIQYLTDDEIESIKLSASDDYDMLYDSDDYDWDTFEMLFDEAFGQLVDENLAN